MTKIASAETSKKDSWPLPTRVGPYRVEGRLGLGGMGQVLRAWDERLERPVAVKNIRVDALSDPTIRERFRREAKATARLSHRGIVRVYDILENEDGDWIVMELVDGQSLKDLLRRKSLSIRSVLRIGRQLAEGLAAAHREGIVHRDLKLENVMITDSGRVKILDFGLAKSVHQADESGLSVAGAVLGTVRAMSPEQAAGRETDHRSDLFSLGTLLFEVLTGSSPFQAENEVLTLRRIRQDTHPSVLTLNALVPESLARLMDQLLAKSPDDRPANADVVAEQLIEILSTFEDSAPKPSGFFSKTLLGCRLTSQGEMKRALDRKDSYADLGDARWYRILARHDRMLRELAVQHEAFELDHRDGFIFLVDGAAIAVRLALAYRQALGELAEEVGLPFAGGSVVHVGEIFLSESTKEEMAWGARPREAFGPARDELKVFLDAVRASQILLTEKAAGEAQERLQNEFPWENRGPMAGAELGEILEVAAIKKPMLTVGKALVTGRQETSWPSWTIPVATFLLGAVLTFALQKLF